MFQVDDDNVGSAVVSYIDQGNPNNYPPIGEWDVSQVRNFGGLFEFRNTFNENINNWNVSNGTNFEMMFSGCTAFNQPLNDWNTSSATHMNLMFENCIAFNCPLNNWNVSNVVDMNSMFVDCHAFNQPLNDWDVSNVTDTSSMFSGCRHFSQTLLNWNINSIENHRHMFDHCPMRHQRWKWDTSFPQPDDVHDDDDGGHDDDDESYYTDEDEEEDEVEEEEEPMQGVAFEIHNQFNTINIEHLLQLIGRNTSNTSVSEIYVKFINIANAVYNRLSAVDKETMRTQNQSLSNKYLAVFNSRNLSLSDLQTLNSVFEFVKSQPVDYQNNYMRFFMHDSANAYSTGVDTTSCVAGIRERLITSLASAGVGQTNPLYAEIASVIHPLQNSAIYHFINKCIEQLNNELKSLPEIDERKSKVTECVVGKILEAYPSAPHASIRERVMLLINQVEDMLQDESLDGGGGRRTRRNIPDFRKNKTRSYKKYRKSGIAKQPRKTIKKRSHKRGGKKQTTKCKR